MKILYLQCNMGAAGDMLTASLASLLPDPNVYLDTINGMGLEGVKQRSSDQPQKEWRAFTPMS